MARVEERLTLGSLRMLFEKAVSGDTSIVPMRGFRLMSSETPKMFRLFFRTGCECGNAALLTVEISKSKSPKELEAAMPSLLERLNMQATRFQTMSCVQHRQMAGREASQSPGEEPG
jgi:hypothetical protein